eukprot:SAG31_NODE_29157_length_400_cov_0.544850_1_plen_39_part_01
MMMSELLKFSSIVVAQMLSLALQPLAAAAPPPPVIFWHS